jgi:hypothetical protein
METEFSFACQKRTRKAPAAFEAREARTRELLAPGDPKEEGFKQKCWRFVHSHENLLTAFLFCADLKSRTRGAK